MIYLTIINTISIIYILNHRNFSISENKTFGNILVGYKFYYKNKQYFYFPIKNQRKEEIKHDVDRLINSDQQKKRQALGAMFSWLKTISDVEQFEKDYAIIDREIVDRLIAEFKSKNNICQ